MYNDEFVAAIDVGTTKIVAAVGRKNKDGKLEVLGMEKIKSQGIKRGVILNIEESTSAFNEVISKLEKKLNLKISEVNVGIAGQHIKCVKNKVYRYIHNQESVVTKETVKELVRDNFKMPIQVGEQVLHVIPLDYVVDKENGIYNPIGMAGKRIDGNFNVIVGRTASVKNIENCIVNTGLSIKEIILEPLASAEAVLSKEEKESGVIMVDIGGGTTDVAIYYDGVLRQTSVIPFGGDTITKDIKEGCGIMVDKAEKIKVNFGEAIGKYVDEKKVISISGSGGWDDKRISFKTVAYIIQSRMEEIIDSINKEIISSGLKNKIGCGIVVTGGGAMLKNLDKLIKFKTGFDVRIGYPDKNITDDKTDMYHPMFSTSVGLLLKYSTENNENKTRKDNKTNTSKGKGLFKWLMSGIVDTEDVEI